MLYEELNEKNTNLYQIILEYIKNYGNIGKKFDDKNQTQVYLKEIK